MEDSKSSEASRFSCEFWGSAKTLGLCSRCLLEHVQKSSDTLELDGPDLGGSSVFHPLSAKGFPDKMDSNPKHCPTRPSADNLADDQKDSNSLPTSCATSSATPPTGSEAGSSRQPSTSYGINEMSATVTESPAVGMKGNEDCVPSSSQNVERPSGGSPHRSSDITITLPGSPPCVVKIPTDKHVCNTSVPSSQLSASSTAALKIDQDEISGLCTPAEPADRGIKRSHAEVETEIAASPSPVKQKNKKRCFKCSCKLELAQREIGRCRCDRVFCPMHRLPELHGCDFDHKEDGRREAREKMVKPTRHLGTSFRRLDHSS